MERETDMYERILTAYFSGTGGARRVAEAFHSELGKRKVDSAIVSMDYFDPSIPSINTMIESRDLVIIIFAVHAFDAPDPVYAWIDRLAVSGKKACVISVSAGGEHGPNKASRAGCIEALTQKGFEIVYESMLIMPCNWTLATNDHTAMRLIRIVPKRVNEICNDLLSGIIRRERAKLGMFGRLISKAEKYGATRFPRTFTIGAECNGCSYCAEHCPVQNIVMEGSTPKFLDHCTMCMRCIYSCPRKALASTSFMALKSGFDLKALEKRMEGVELKPIAECAKGMAWSGVRKYLVEQESAQRQTP
jgi:ferredoxin